MTSKPKEQKRYGLSDHVTAIKKALKYPDLTEERLRFLSDSRESNKQTEETPYTEENSQLPVYNTNP